MIAIVLQNGSELKSAEVNNLKFKVTLDLFASKEEGESDNYIYKGYFQSQVNNPG